MTRQTQPSGNVFLDFQNALRKRELCPLGRLRLSEPLPLAQRAGHWTFLFYDTHKREPETRCTINAFQTLGRRIPQTRISARRHGFGCGVCGEDAHPAHIGLVHTTLAQSRRMTPAC